MPRSVSLGRQSDCVVTCPHWHLHECSEANDPLAFETATRLATRLRDAGVETVSLWAGLPHYIAATPNARGVLALVHKVTEVLDFRVDEGPLEQSAAVGLAQTTVPPAHSPVPQD